MAKKIHFKVLHCIHSLSSGGAERQLNIFLNVKNELLLNSIMCVKSSGNTINNDEVKIFENARSNKYDFSVVRALLDVIDQVKPDIIHAWLPASITIPVMVVSKLKGVPCVFSYRNAMFFHRPLSYFEFLIALVFAKKVISNNPICQSNVFYRLLFKVKNGKEIKNAVCLDLKKQVIDMKGKRELHFLFVGRLTKQKNWRCLIKALSLLNLSHEYKLLICGDGEDKNSLFDMIADFEIQDKVKFMGFRDDVYDIMLESDVLIMPSWYEGMPNVLLEAFKIGLPAIASNIVANRELVGNDNCVLFFDPESEIELAEKITQAVSDQEATMQRVNNGLKLAEKYSPEAMVNSYVAEYKKLLNQ